MLTRDPRSIYSLIAWLKTMDPNERYKSGHYRGGCLISKYLEYIGHPETTYGKLWGELHDKFFNTIVKGPHEYSTFGEALERAELHARLPAQTVYGYDSPA